MVSNGEHTNAASRLKRRLVASVLFVVLAEVVMFNYPFWESLTYSNGGQVSYAVSEGMRPVSDGVYELSERDSSYIEFDCGGVRVGNIELQLGMDGEGDTWRQGSGQVLPVSVSITDAANALFLDLPAVEYCSGLPDTHFIRIHTRGPSDAMRVYFDKPGQVLSVDRVAINSVRPFHVSWFRVLLVAAVVALFQVFRPSSALYKETFDAGSVHTRAAVVATVAVSMAVVVCVGQLSGLEGTADTEPVYYTEGGGYAYDYNQYNHLADAFLAGRVHLDLPVSQTLLDLENPYDRNARMQRLAETGEHAFMDYAYYDGKYYSYFGALPALLLFAPVKAATGHDLRTDHAVVLFGLLCVLSLTALFLSLHVRFARQRNLGLAILGLVSLLSCCGILGLVFYPVVYSVPFLSALFFASAGLFLWVRARRADGGLSCIRLAVGGLLVACTLGCRPAFMLVAVLAFPLFWDDITKQRAFFAPTGIAVRNTACVIVPLLVVGLAAMLYNAARFGSPFDFGAAYNITGTDMTKRGFELALVPIGLFELLFQPLNISLSFPFVHGVDMVTDYQGHWFHEPFLGGFFAHAPVCLALVGLWFKRDDVAKAGALGLCWTMVALALVCAVIDFEVASITSRYFADFGWLLIVAAWLVVFSVAEGMRSRQSMEGPWGVALVAFACMGIAVSFWALVADDRYFTLADNCPVIYYSLKSWLMVFF